MSAKVTIEDEIRITEFYIPKDKIHFVDQLLSMCATSAQNIPKQPSRLPRTIKEG